MSALPSFASRGLVLPFAALAAVAISFGAGRWSAPSAAPSARPTRPDPRGGAQRGYAPATPPTASGERGGVPAPFAQPSAGPSPELVAAVTTEAAVRFEAQRQAIVSSCWPSGGLANGRTSARIRVNVTFDREGREIARGIQEDRRASSGEFTRCLRSMEKTRLAVAPPGANVGVTFPVQFP